MATTKIKGKRYSDKPADVVRFYTSKGKASGQPWEYSIILQISEFKTQRITFSEVEMKRIFEHLQIEK
ncbi:MAG: hypothetical protein ABIU30_18515 [Ferruginibacter sp.]